MRTVMATQRTWCPLCFKHFTWTFFCWMKFKNNATEKKYTAFRLLSKFLSHIYLFIFNVFYQTNWSVLQGLNLLTDTLKITIIFHVFLRQPISCLHVTRSISTMNEWQRDLFKSASSCQYLYYKQNSTWLLGYVEFNSIPHSLVSFAAVIRVVT